jgi:hypothetical protein
MPTMPTTRATNGKPNPLPPPIDERPTADELRRLQRAREPARNGGRRSVDAAMAMLLAGLPLSAIERTTWADLQQLRLPARAWQAIALAAADPRQHPRAIGPASTRTGRLTKQSALARRLARRQVKRLGRRYLLRNLRGILPGRRYSLAAWAPNDHRSAPLLALIRRQADAIQASSD